MASNTLAQIVQQRDFQEALGRHLTTGLMAIHPEAIAEVLELLPRPSIMRPDE